MKRPVRGLSANSRGVIAFAVLLLALLPAGCGSGGETTAITQTATAQEETPSQHDPAPAVSAKGSADARQADEQPQTSPTSKAVPQSSSSGPSEPLPPTDTASKDAREAGRQACHGMTALEAAKHFEIPARLAGVDKEFAEFVAEPPPSTETSSGYPRLVAALYATTLPAAQREQAAAGCAEELTPPSGG